MARPISIQGSKRQELYTKSGLLLHRAYLVMLPEHWNYAQAQSKAEGFASTSEYISHLVATEKEKNDAGNL